MGKKRPVVLFIFAILGFICAVVNLGLFIMQCMLMGFTWKLEVTRRFIAGRPDAIPLLWSNFSPLIIGILLVYTGLYLFKMIRLKFIVITAILFLIVNIFFIGGNPTLIIFSFFNMIYFVLLLTTISISPLRRQFN